VLSSAKNFAVYLRTTCTEQAVSKRIRLLKENTMPKNNPEAGEQVAARPHDSGSQANETVDGLNADAEALRHAAEDTPSGAMPDDVEKTPVFDRAGQAPKV
jgi:hypothetical protein